MDPPSHIGIQGNDLADTAAKTALTNNISSILLPPSDFKHDCDTYIKSLWQRQWNLDINNKLFSVKPNIGITALHSTFRKDDVVITRLRIGHSYYTHSYLLLGDPHPVCAHCGTNISIHHLLLDCPLFDVHRRRLHR